MQIITSSIVHKDYKLITKFSQTDAMLADSMTKPLMGAQFLKLRKIIINIIGQQEYVSARTSGTG
jgi:hypothetical protein